MSQKVKVMSWLRLRLTIVLLLGLLVVIIGAENLLKELVHVYLRSSNSAAKTLMIR